MSSTVCLTDTSVIPFPSKEFAYTLSSNTAGRPLPHIPCRPRPSPTGHGHSFSDSQLPRMREPSYLTSSNPSTNPPLTSGYESDSSSSSTSSDGICPTIMPRSKNSHSQRARAQVSTEATSFRVKDSGPDNPSHDWSDDDTSPHSLLRIKVGKCALDEPAPKHAHHVAEPKVNALAATLPPVHPSKPCTIRKKSGELVKPSLKRRPQLSVVTGGGSAKSAPATPTPTKAVHFDSKLEHIKLFLAEQKPLAVSRDGSPNSDTSGTDDFPFFIYGDPPKAQKQVQMSIRNMPPTPRKNDDVSLQELTLLEDQRTLLGRVRVRNIAYEKWLAARFTTDWWQTTSEVAARYEKSAEDGAFDIFTFFIRLHDIWNRIEDKSLFMALRYVAGGKECWDNNEGRNYHVKFAANPIPLSDRQSGAAGNAGDMSMKDLKMRLEEVARTKAAPRVAPASRVQASFGGSPTSPPLPSLKSLSQRYDFGSASKWKPRPTLRHTRTHTYPAAGPPPPRNPSPMERKVIDGDESKRGEFPDSSKEQPPSTPSSSPLVMCKETPSLPRVADTTETGHSTALAGRSHHPEERRRNHVRGYVDHAMPNSPTVKKTPPGLSPHDGPLDGLNQSLPRLHSYPFTENSLSMDRGLGRLKPDGSPPPTAGSQDTQKDEETGTSEVSPTKPLARPDTTYKDVSGAPPGDAYQQFVNQYCFYTGADSPLEDSTTICRRPPPTATFEPYLLSQSPPAHMHMFSPHVRDLATFSPTQRSGPVTPTGPSMTPIAG